MGAQRQEAATPANTADEKEKLLAELYALTCRADSIEEAIESRRARLQAMMNADGDVEFSHERWGKAVFGPRRTFKVIDPKKLADKLTKELLAAGFKPTAALVDAMAQKGISIEGMIQVGVNESWTFSRPQTARAEAARKRFIAESRAQAEAKVAEIMAAL